MSSGAQKFLVLTLLYFIAVTSVQPAPNGPEEQSSGPAEDAGNGDRAMGYKKKSNVVTTVRPTWRPQQIPKEIENPAIDVPDDNSAEPDELFEKEYYDEYDADVEGTKRHIAVFHTFEERMKTYVKMLQKYHAASAGTDSGKGRSAAKKNGGGSRSLGGGSRSAGGGSRSLGGGGDVEQTRPSGGSKKDTGGAKNPPLLGLNLGGLLG